MKYSWIFFAGLLFFINACQKQIQPPYEAPVEPDSVYTLKRFVVVDPGLVAPTDSIYTYSYAYDNLNRCTGIISTDMYAGTFYTTTNYFNGNDTLMYKRSVVWDGTGEEAAEFFSYNGNGIMVYDSLVNTGGSNPGYISYRYSINNNRISLVTSIGNPPYKGTYILGRNGDGDLTSEVDSGFVYDLASSAYMLDVVSNHTNTYDANHCPFYKLYPLSPVILEYENYLRDDKPMYMSLFQQHNILTETRTVVPTSSGLMTYNNAYTYHYNADGYPTDVIIQELATGKTYKGYYFY